MDKCAPGSEFKDGSCISVDVLIEMVKAYNKEYSDNKIELDDKMDALHPGTYKKKLIKEFSSRLGDICDDQTCWVKQSFTEHMKEAMQDELKRNTFRPTGPSGKFTWLNTLNINNVMRQYENKFPDFKFFGAVPIDFDDLSRYEHRKLNPASLLAQGKSKLGFVFNLDEHWKSGSHWVAMYADLNKEQIYFFDSFGTRPHKRIRTLMNRIADGLSDKATVEYNHIQHQKKNTECGVYSMNFIIRLLNGESYEDITQNITDDRQINKCRDVYFA